MMRYAYQLRVPSLESPASCFKPTALSSRLLALSSKLLVEAARGRG